LSGIRSNESPLVHFRFLDLGHEQGISREVASVDISSDSASGTMSEETTRILRWPLAEPDQPSSCPRSRAVGNRVRMEIDGGATIDTRTPPSQEEGGRDSRTGASGVSPLAGWGADARYANLVTTAISDHGDRPAQSPARRPTWTDSSLARAPLRHTRLDIPKDRLETGAGIWLFAFSEQITRLTVCRSASPGFPRKHCVVPRPQCETAPGSLPAPSP
jgi:hypothetical protein